uniref:Uncharacterized protein n=1 Tax=Dulem virus 31 TaxID=3145749 RepID=A0AAU8ATF8_9VIRU
MKNLSVVILAIVPVEVPLNFANPQRSSFFFAVRKDCSGNPTIAALTAVSPMFKSGIEK